MWKRVAAALFDLILLTVLGVGCCWMISGILGFDSCNDQLLGAYDRYEQQYGVSFEVSQEEFNAMTQTQRDNYDAAYEALLADEGAMEAYSMVVSFSFLIPTFGILIAMAVLEFGVPLLFGNGQSLGKKMFSLGLMRTDGVKINNLQLLTRTLLGKFTLETMVPIYLVFMIFWGMIGAGGTTILAVIFVVQLCCIGFTRTNSAIHDLLAGTVAVDMTSQEIFGSTEELIEYTKKIHAEKAAQARW